MRTSFDQARKFLRPPLLAILLIVLALGCASVRAQDDQTNIGEMFTRAQDLHEKGDIDAAIVLYKKILDIAPDLPEAHYQLGSAYLSLDRADDAESSFRKAVAARPDWSLAQAALGNILVRKFRRTSSTDANADPLLTEAYAALHKAIELDPKNAPAWSALADLQLASGASKADLASTLAAVRDLTDGKMNAPSALWVTRALLERSAGDPAAAKKSLETALAASPNDRTALSLNAELALAGGDIEGAKRASERLSAAGASDEAHFIASRVLAEGGDAAAALVELKKVGSPTREMTAFGRTLEANASQNVPDLESRLATDPKNAAILGRLCALERVTDPAKALEYCRRASEAEPNNIAHAIGFAAALVQARAFDQAAAILTKILAAAPDNTTAHANLATAYMSLRSWANARDQYQWLIDHKSGLPIAYYLIAITHDQLGAYRDAVANYQLFLRNADPAKNKLEIDKVELRLPAVEKLAKQMKSH